MIEAFKEQERLERQERRLQFRDDVKQKAGSLFAKLGKVKNATLSKLSLANIDVKLRNAFEQAQIATLTAVNNGVEAASTVKESITEFTSEQIARYYNWRSKKEEERVRKQFENSIRQLELEEIEKIKARTKEHEQGMKYALNEQERAMYEAKHKENEARKQELIDSLFGTDSEYLEQEGLARAI